jgi:sugar/nucleoside kinase (ribokinase family)
VHAGLIQVLISTQQVNGTLVVTIEDTYENSFEGNNKDKATNIRDWYIAKVAKEAKASGFGLSQAHRLLYLGNHGNDYSGIVRF